MSRSPPKKILPPCSLSPSKSRICRSTNYNYYPEYGLSLDGDDPELSENSNSEGPGAGSEENQMNHNAADTGASYSYTTTTGAGDVTAQSNNSVRTFGAQV